MALLHAVAARFLLPAMRTFQVRADGGSASVFMQSLPLSGFFDAGTIFHKTRTPMVKWFWLIYRMATSKTGVSIAEMQRELQVRDYRTMWVMAHKVRKAMADRDGQYRLAGVVEIDESFFGPRTSGKRGRGAQGKSVVIVAVSTWMNSSGEEEPGLHMRLWPQIHPRRPSRIC